MRRSMLVLAVIVIAAIAMPATAKVYTGSVFEWIGQSDVIIAGSVVELQDESAVIKVDQVLKGQVNGDQVTVSPVGIDGMKGMFIQFTKGEALVVFLKSGPNGELTMVGNGMAKHRIARGREMSDVEAVRRLMAIADLKDEDPMNKAMLVESTSPNPLLRQEAQSYVIMKVSHSELRQNYKADLIALLKSSEKDVRMTALHGLQFVKAEEAIPLMVKATRETDLPLVSAASMALAQYDTPESVNALIALTESTNPDFRVRACIDLDDSRRPESKEALKKLLDDPDPKVRAMGPRGLVMWLRRHQADEVIPKLTEMLNDPVDEVQAEAAQQLGESLHFSAVQPLLDVLKRDELSANLDRCVLQAIHMLYGEQDPRFAATVNENADLIAKALDRGQWAGSICAVEMLAKAKTAEAITALERAAKNHPREDIRQMAAKALKNL